MGSRKYWHKWGRRRERGEGRKKERLGGGSTAAAMVEFSPLFVEGGKKGSSNLTGAGGGRRNELGQEKRLRESPFARIFKGKKRRGLGIANFLFYPAKFCSSHSFLYFSATRVNFLAKPKEQKDRAKEEWGE